MTVVPDRPIRSSEQDRFGFTDTVLSRLAAVTTGTPARDGLVVGLVGAWGSGKSSVLNLLEEKYEEIPQAAAIIRFSPWFYDDPRALTLAFFGAISAELTGKSDPMLRKAGEAFGSIGTGVGVAAMGLDLLVPGIGTTAVAGAHLVDRVGEVLEGLGNASADLNGARQRAESALGEVGAADKRVLVLIDDVDRLSHRELTTLFRLVRTVGDLPAMSLVLAIDEERVRELLDAGSGDVFGSGYLDKILEAKVHVPRPIPPRMRALLVERMREVFEVAHLPYPDALKDNELFRTRELRALEQLVETPRDIARFTNAMAVLLLATVLKSELL